MFHWKPKDGAVVHVKPTNPWGLGAGRYRLEQPTGCRDWHLHGITVMGWAEITSADLRVQETLHTVTPISADEMADELQRLQLAVRAPLRRAAQRDVGDLDLFRAANEPRLM